MSSLAKQEELPPWGIALAGSGGALVANLLVYPLDLAKTKLQVQVKRNEKDTHEDLPGHVHYEGTLHAIQHIIETDGVSGLFNGITGNLIGVVSTNFAYFYSYGLVRDIYHTRIQKGKTAPNTATELLLGAIAGALAQLFTIPVGVVTTRQQLQAKTEKKGLFATAQEVIDGPDGVAGLWRGLKASMVLVVNPAITYGAYERLRTVLFAGKTNLQAHEAFLLGSLSKMLATVATQPLIVAKVGLQGKPPPARKGVPFNGFIDVMKFIVERDGVLGLYKGITPQLMKGFLVQGLLMMTKERVELLFVLLFRYVRQLRRNQLEKLAQVAADVNQAKRTTV